MLVTYSPEGAEKPSVWEFDPKRVRQSAAELIEKRYGGRYDEFVEAVQRGQAKARRVLLWHLMVRDGHPSLRYEDVPDFYMGDLEVDYSIDDLQSLRGQIAESSMADDEREAMLERLDLEIATRLGKADSTELTAAELGKDSPSNVDG